MSYTSSYFHIVFCTYRRYPVLSQEHKGELIHYCCGIAKNLNVFISDMEVMPEHVHIVADLHSTVALAKFVGTLKQSSSLWLGNNKNFPQFTKWCKEYYGASVSAINLHSLRHYVKTQEEHHRTNHFGDEIKALVEHDGHYFHPDSFML